MSGGGATRREFLKATSAAAAAAALGAGARAGESPAGPPKILNYNPRMGYRRLGKTELLISEVSLGGHGGSSWKDRVPVLERAAELGMNYLDTNIGDEVAMYGDAMEKALRGKRDSFYIGFADWPVKLTPDYEGELTADLLLAEIEKRLKSYRTEMLDIWRPVGATWGPGQTERETMLTVSDRTLDLVVETFEKAKRQGKVRFLGISAHNPKVFRNVLAKYPQFSVILFPYLFLTKEAGDESLLALAKEKDVGVIGIKPFAAGATFGLPSEALRGGVDPRAHVLVREMLREKRIAAIIPGVATPEQLEENVRGSYERDAPASAEEKTALRECLENYRRRLQPEYAWLREWEVV